MSCQKMDRKRLSDCAASGTEPLASVSLKTHSSFEHHVFTPLPRSPHPLTHTRTQPRARMTPHPHVNNANEQLKKLQTIVLESPNGRSVGRCGGLVEQPVTSRPARPVTAAPGRAQ